MSCRSNNVQTVVVVIIYSGQGNGKQTGIITNESQGVAAQPEWRLTSIIFPEFVSNCKFSNILPITNFPNQNQL